MSSYNKYIISIMIWFFAYIPISFCLFTFVVDCGAFWQIVTGAGLVGIFHAIKDLLIYPRCYTDET